MMMCSMNNTRSSLELMLDSIRKKDEQPVDVPPALPIRPVSRARLPTGRRKLPIRLHTNCLIEGPKENEVKNNDGYSGDIVVEKIDSLNSKDDKIEKLLEKILEIQKSFRGHQVRCYFLQLKRGTITLQSFVRGETARKNFKLLSKKMEAVIVIQRHTKQLVVWRKMQERQRAVISLQSAIRGWLTRRSISHKEKLRLREIENKEAIRKPGCIHPETTDQNQVSPSALADLQRRLVMMETKLGKKEEENAAIKQQLRQYDEKWLEYEKKMKSMANKWQDQLASLQMSLLAAQNSLATERTRDRLGNFIPISLNCYSNADEIIPNEMHATCGRTMNDFLYSRNDNEPQIRNNRVDDANLHANPSRNSFQDESKKGPNEEFRNLKLRFEVWKKDYKVQLQEAKTMLQKLGHLEAKKSRKKWWGR